MVIVGFESGSYSKEFWSCKIFFVLLCKEEINGL